MTFARLVAVFVLLSFTARAEKINYQGDILPGDLLVAYQKFAEAVKTRPEPGITTEFALPQSVEWSLEERAQNREYGRDMNMAFLKKPVVATLLDIARTTLAALASMLLARVLKLPEYYWAPISAIVITESTIDPRALAWQRFAGTAVGAVAGALIMAFFPAKAVVYAAAIFVCGVLSAIMRLSTAYRFAAITVSIILLVPHTASPRVVAWHRFVEVSLGIAVALAVGEVWPIKR